MTKQEALDLVKEHTTFLCKIRDEIRQAQNYLVEIDPAIAKCINESSNKNDGSELIMALENVVIPLLEREATIERWVREDLDKDPRIFDRVDPISLQQLRETLNQDNK